MDSATDLAIQGTNTSSITSKRSLERLGYLNHNHIEGVTERDSPLLLKYIVPKPQRRSPVIHRAYYQRTEGIRVLVEGWLAECVEQEWIERCTVVSLGCGFDLTYFRLSGLFAQQQQQQQQQQQHEQESGNKKFPKFDYIDLDYPTLIHQRLTKISTTPVLQSRLPTTNIIQNDDQGFISFGSYSCLGVDLRDLRLLKEKLELAGLITQDGKKDDCRAVLVISEVVLAYLGPKESDQVLRWFAETGFKDMTFVLHEQCIPEFYNNIQGQENNNNNNNNDNDNDATKKESEWMHPFASTMFAHFKSTLTPLETLKVYKTLENHRDRLLNLGWTDPETTVMNMNLFSDLTICRDFNQRQRIARLEPFDEFDELAWIGAHYFMAVGKKTNFREEEVVGKGGVDVLQRLGIRQALKESKFKDCFSTVGDPSRGKDKSRAADLETGSATTTTTSSVEWGIIDPFTGLDIPRRGHSLCIVDNEAWIFGGFGMENEISEPSPSSPPSSSSPSVTTPRRFLPPPPIAASTTAPNVTQQQQQRLQTRLGSLIRYNLDTRDMSVIAKSPEGPNPRMYHSACVSESGVMFVYGGRDGPTKVHNDVWQYTTETGWLCVWKSNHLPTATLGHGDNNDDANDHGHEGHKEHEPSGYYKHTATIVKIQGEREVMMVIGGRDAKGVAQKSVWGFDIQDCMWGKFEWQDLQPENELSHGIFSHAACLVPLTSPQSEASVLVMGGIRGVDEIVLNQVYKVWFGFEVDEDTQSVKCWARAKTVDLSTSDSSLGELSARFGHTMVCVNKKEETETKPDNVHVWILGGVSAPGFLQWDETILELVLQDNGGESPTALVKKVQPTEFKPLVMVGHATAFDPARERVIGVGGGGTCFGFGAWYDSLQGWCLDI